MLRPTIYIASKDLGLLTGTGRAADRALAPAKPGTEPRPVPRTEARALVAVGNEKD